MEAVKIRIKKDDKVKVLTGKDKGKIAKVLTGSRKKGRITVENINVVKRHQKPSQANPQGGIVDKAVKVLRDFENSFLAYLKQGMLNLV